MSAVASSGATVRLSLVIVVPPVVSAIGSAAFIPESRTTGPLVFASPLWMCEMMIIVVAGKPLRTISNFAVAAVILPVESFVVVSVTVVVPLPLACVGDRRGFVRRRQGGGGDKNGLPGRGPGGRGGGRRPGGCRRARRPG